MSRNFMVDCEANGQCPGFHNMTMFSAVCVEDPEHYWFFSNLLKPIIVGEKRGWRNHNYEYLMENGLNPVGVMEDFSKWLYKVTEGKRPFFWSDNNGWDYQWINYYFHFAGIENPFGHTSSNLGSFYKGLVRNLHKNFKHLRKTKHTHHPTDDAIGNIEALRTLIEREGVYGI